MKYIDELLKGHEVVWKELGEVADIYGGLTGKSKSDFEDGNALFISYKNIYDNYEINNQDLPKVKVSETEQQHKVEYGDVLFTGSSETADEVAYSSAVTTHFSEAVYLNSFSFGVRFHKDIELIPEFSKHLFRGVYMRKQMAKTASGVTRFNVSKARFKKILIPLPPLSVQEEIVRILDKFTTLEAELEAELDCRKRQYEYYRNQLLSFDIINLNDAQVSKIKVMPLGEIVTIKNGKSYKHLSMGNVPVYGSGGIMCFVDEYIYNKPSVLIPRKGSLENIFYLEEPFWNVDTIFYTEINDKIIMPKFLYYYLLNQHLEKLNLAGGVPSLTQKDLNKVLIPIPPLSEQERIVSILDKFDTLVNSISEGLPKEIELRRKQYEYYREQLLSFRH